MVKLEYLNGYEVYKTRPPVIMPEHPANRKKFHAVMVLAPSVEDELNFLATTNVLRFRYLTKYFIDKRWEHTFIGQGRKIIKPDDEGQITALLKTYSGKGALKQITDVTTYLSSAPTRPLKMFNTLVEVNHMYDAIVNNPKDHRLTSVRAKEILDEYLRFSTAAFGIDGYIGDYTLTTVIPMNLWFTEDDYRNPNALFRRASRNIMAQILMQLDDLSKVAKLGTIVLIHANLIMKLTPDAPEKAKDTFFMDAIRAFMQKARLLGTPEEDAMEEVDDETGAIDDRGAQEGLRRAEEETKKDIVTDEILQKAKVDPDKVPYDEKQQVRRVVERRSPQRWSTKDVISSGPPAAPAANKGTHAQPQSDEGPDLDPAVDDVPVPEDIEVPQVDDLVLSQDETDVVLKAKMAGKSIKSYQRDEMLKEKYKELKFGETPITDLAIDEGQYEVPAVPVRANTVNENLRNIRTHKFEQAYNENLMQKHLVAILMHFSHVKPALYLNKDIQIEDVSTSTDRLLRYTVEFEDEYRKRHRFSFLMPKMYKDRYLYINGKQLNITHQKFPFPVTKIGPDRCQVVSNYNKIISNRYGSSLSPRITKIKKIFSGPSCPRCAKVIGGDATSYNRPYLTTVEYDDLASTMLRLQLGNSKKITTIYFVAHEALAAISPADSSFLKTVIEKKPANEEIENLIPLATDKLAGTKGPGIAYYLSGATNIVYDDEWKPYGELSEFIVDKASDYDEYIAKDFANTSAGSKFMYSRSKIMATDIPMVLVLAAADPNGLVGVLEKGKINYQFTDKRPSVDKDTKGVIPFSDGWLVYDRYPFENSLFMNGLSTFPTKEFGFYDMGIRDTYVEIFDLLYNRRTLIDGIENFYYMMIDPITLNVLIRLGLPTDFTRLMLYCNGMLADNAFHIDSAYDDTRIRSNEIVNAHLYKHLADAWGAYKDGRAEKFSIREDAVIKSLLTSNIVDPHTTLNVTLEVETDNQVKLKGPSGMNEDRSFTVEKRAYHPTMRGIVGMNSTPSGEVGINRHLTTNANIDDAMGFVTIDKNEYDGTELLTPGEMLQTFGPESADIERVAMAISQSKHLVPVESQCSSPISYDMERVIPFISSDFAVVAKGKGKVVAIENDLMIIQYSDGSYQDIDLSEHPVKNTDGGFYVMNKMDTTLKVGDSFKEGEVIAFDKKYMNDKDMFGDVTASVGTLARIAIETNGGVFEDACYITDELAHRLATKATQEKRIILSKYANIKYIAKVGQAVKANDPILLFDDTEDEFASQMLAGMAAEAEDSDEIIATTAPVVTKVTGVVRDIQITYTIPIEEMSPSLGKIVSEYVKGAKKREKTLAKYISPKDSSTILRTSEMSVPDSTGKVAGIKIGDGVQINFYIEYYDVMSVGDKLTNFTALKGVVSDVIPANLAAYTESDPDRKIEAALSCIGVYKRMCLDIIKVGGLTKMCVEKKRMLKEKYGQRIKDELKRK